MKRKMNLSVFRLVRMVINAETAEDLLRAAGLLQMTTLQDSCESYYAENLNLDNALAVWNLAQCLHCEALAEKAKRFILANFMDIYTEPDFLHIDIEHLNELLIDDDLRIPDEDHVSESVVSWIRYDIKTRSKYVNEICMNLRLRYLSEDALLHLISFVRNECHMDDSVLEGFMESKRYSFSEASAGVSIETSLTSRNYENMLVVIGVHKATGILPSVHAYSFNTKVILNHSNYFSNVIYMGESSTVYTIFFTLSLEKFARPILEYNFPLIIFFV